MEKTIIIDIEDMKSWLMMNDWDFNQVNEHFAEISRENVFDDNNNVVKLLIPINNRLCDYNSRMSSIVHSIASIEDKNYIDIINEIIPSNKQRLILGMKIDDFLMSNLMERKVLGNVLDKILFEMEEQHLEVPLELIELKNWLRLKGNSLREQGDCSLWNIEKE